MLRTTIGGEAWWLNHAAVRLRLFLLILFPFCLQAYAVPAGDIAPRGNPDSVVDAADLLVLQRIILNDIIPTPEETRIADVAPLGAPDGVLNAGDLVVLMRAVEGQITLPDVSLGPTPPILDAAGGSTNANPYVVTGSAPTGMTVRLYVNNLLQASTVAVGDAFSFEAALLDGFNSISATTWDGSTESLPSNQLTVDYVNNIARTRTNTVIGQNTVWTAGAPAQPYLISGTLGVSQGASLILQPGVVLQFDSGAQMTVDGTLEVRGTGTSPVVLTSSGALTKGAWAGLVIGATGAGSVIDHARFEYAKTPVLVDGADVTVRNSVFRDFGGGWGDAAIHMRNGAGGLLDANDIATSSQAGEAGILLEQSSPTITANTIQSLQSGITVTTGSAPVINGENLITGNGYGVYIYGDYNNPVNDPMPSIHGNSLYGNTLYNLSAYGYAGPAVTELDISDNWWGSADTNAIAIGMYGFKDEWDANTPVLKVVPFRAAQGGPDQAGKFLNGIIPAGTSVGAGETYEAVGTVLVPDGVTFNIGAGATVKFADDALFYVFGLAVAQGAPGTMVNLVSDSPTPSAGSWQGVAIVNLNATGNTSVFSNTRFEYGGVAVFDGSVQITDSDLQYARIDMRIDTGGTIAGNTLDGHGLASSGISTNTANLTIVGNQISNYTNGIYVFGGDASVRSNTIQNNQNGLVFTSLNKSVMTATVSDGNVITANSYGISVNTGGSTSTVTINGNSIHDNQLYNLYAQSYGIGPGKINVIDATGNWWGTEDPQVLLGTLFDQTDAPATSSAVNAPFVDFSPFKAVDSSLRQAGLMLGVLDGPVTVDAGASLVMQGPVLVPPGATLGLGEGATLLFPQRASLVVQGSLASGGTRDNPVVLSSAKTPGTQAAGDWYGVLVNADGVAVNNARIEYTEHAVSIFASAAATVSGCRISDFLNEGILMTYLDVSKTRFVSSGALTGNTVTQTLVQSGVGMHVVDASPRIADNIINNLTTGIRLDYTNTSEIAGNIVRDNTQYGIQLQSGFLANPGSSVGSYLDPKPLINNNSIYGNNTYPNSSYNVLINRPGLNNYSGNPGTYILDATGNWWNTDVDADIAATLYVSTDKQSIAPTISYTPFLSGPIAFVPTLDAGAPITNNAAYPVTGRADPGVTVRIYANGAFQSEVTADPAGQFAAQATLTEGANTVWATAYNGANESDASNVLSVTLDTVPPVITVTAPADGTRTNNAISVSGALSEPGTLTVAGAATAVAADNSFSSGPVALVEGPNVITLQATDAAGNVGSLDLNVTLDSTPPADPVTALISFDDSVAGQVTATGSAGSVDASVLVTLVNARSGETVQTTAALDGSFTLTLAVSPGDELNLLASDDVGNQTAWSSYVVAGTPPPLAVSISSPLDGATVSGDSVSIAGTLTGPVNTGVTVNGVTATVSNGQFIATNVAVLASGTTSVTATATAPDGTVASSSINVTKGPSDPLTLSVTPDSGIAPLLVSFEVDLAGAFDISSVEIDSDGDGTYDISGSDITYTWGKDALNNDIVVKATATHQYTVPGIYTARARVVGTGLYNGTTYVLEHPVVAQDAVGVGANLRRIYNRMLNLLQVGNASGALSLLSQTMQDKYTGLFTSQTVDFSQLIPQLGEVVGGGISDDVGFLVVKRVENSQELYFTVYFSRGPDGVWRIGEM